MRSLEPERAQNTYKGHKILLLLQIDDLSLSTNDESIANEIYTIISDKLQLPNKPEPPFIYLGLINDYSGVDINQCKEYIKINASNYIDWFLTLYGYNNGFKRPTPDKPLSLMPKDSIAKAFNTTDSTV